MNNFFDSSVFEMSRIQWEALFPYLILALGIAITTILSAMKTSLVLLRTVVLFFLSVFTAFQLSALTSPPVELFGNSLEVDIITRLVGAGVSVLAALCCFFSRSSDEGNALEWGPLLLLSVTGLSLLPGARDWVSFFIYLETLAISGYILTALDTHREKSLEAGLKYLFMGSFASALFLMGVTLLYGLSGSFDFDIIRESLQNLGAHQRSFAMTGALLIVVSLGFKVALFPFHMWAPDVYQSAPTGLAAYLASATKLSVFSSLAVAASSCHFWTLEPVKGLLIAISVASIFFGSLMAVAQTKLRRLFAYASIVSAGYAGLALSVGPSAYGVLVLYLFIYGLSFVCAFAAIEVFSIVNSQESHEDLEIHSLAKISKQIPAWIKICFALAVFSMAGLPPMPGFLTKYAILKELWTKKDVFSSAFLVFGSFLGLAYYLKILVPLYLTTDFESEKILAPIHPSKRILWAAGLASTLALISIFICLGGFSRFFQWMSLAEGFAR